MSSRRTEKPYWLDRGEETCEICGSLIVVQALVRCADCDAGICEHCSVTIHETREYFCIPCSEPEARD